MERWMLVDRGLEGGAGGVGAAERESRSDERTEPARSSGHARALLADLAHELPAIEGKGIDPSGSAAAGPQDDSVSGQRQRERRRTRALEALRRLGTMLARGLGGEVHALWWAHVLQGDTARTRAAAGRPGAWLEELGLQLLPPEALIASLRAASRKGAGPEAHAARTRGAAALERAERTFETIVPEGTDGAWLARVRDAVDAQAHAYRVTVREVADEKACARVRSKVAKATLLAATKPAVVASSAQPRLDPEAARWLAGALGFDGDALRCRQAAALVVGDLEAVRCAAVDRGLDAGVLVVVALLLAVQESASP